MIQNGKTLLKWYNGDDIVAWDGEHYLFIRAGRVLNKTSHVATAEKWLGIQIGRATVGAGGRYSDGSVVL